ncbi:MAG: ArsR family transcriptional regulator [Thermoplasmata archaeon]|nr:MAG: ArsR family transcriptional regulator [Thermoplasmata archaeon]
MCEIKDLARIFRALGNETRLRILMMIKDGERCVCEIVSAIERAQPTVSIHLRKLEDLGIVSSRKEGKSVYYRIVDDRVIAIIKMLCI